MAQLIINVSRVSKNFLAPSIYLYSYWKLKSKQPYPYFVGNTYFLPVSCLNFLQNSYASFQFT